MYKMPSDVLVGHYRAVLSLFL